MADLRLSRVRRRFGATVAVDDISLTVADGEFFAVLGPSGCGKSTLLRIVAGFVEPEQGSVHFGERDVTRLAPEKRDAAMVFQSYALFPHLDAGENVAFGLRARAVGEASIRERVGEALALVGLSGRERRAVGELSGGEQQRVALARAVVVRPAVLLLDEPMSNLDLKLREGTRRLLRDLQRKLGITTLYVTHDQHEALEMADRVAVLDHGRLLQVGPPRTLYDQPASAFVATFLGQADLLFGTTVAVADGRAEIELGATGTRVWARTGALGVGDRAQLVVRPESVVLDAAAADSASLGTGRVTAVRFQGATIEVVITLESGTVLQSVQLHHAASKPKEPGAQVRLFVSPDRLVALAVPGREDSPP